MKVIVAGGSLVGLMHGIMLKHRGCDVHILEQTPRSLEAQAAGVGTAQPVKDFLSLHDRLKSPYAIYSDELRLINPRGQITRQIPIVYSLTSWDALYFRLRANFDGLSSPFYPKPPLSESTDGEAVYDVGKKLISVSIEKDEVVVQYQDVHDGHIETARADLLIGADGPNSTVRSLVYPSGPQRQYAGYVGWRGIVSEDQLALSTQELFAKKLCMCPIPQRNEYLVLYTIPGPNGTLEVGRRGINVVWYSHISTTELSAALTDTEGHQHHWSVPKGKLRPEVWQRQLQRAGAHLNDSCRDVIMKLEEPFLQVLSDYSAHRAVFHDGRVLLSGDALALIRLHTGMGISKGAKDVLLLEKAIYEAEKVIEVGSKEYKKRITEWERKVIEFAQLEGLNSKSMGLYHLGGWSGWLPAALQYYLTLLWKRCWSRFARLFRW